MRREFMGCALLLAACGGADEVIIDARGDGPETATDAATDASVDSDVRGPITVRVRDGGRPRVGVPVHLLTRDATVQMLTTDALGVATLDGFAGATVVTYDASGVWMWRGVVPPATITIDPPPRLPAMGAHLIDTVLRVPSPPPGVVSYRVVAPCASVVSVTAADPVEVVLDVHACTIAAAADVWVVARNQAGAPMAYSQATDLDLTSGGPIALPPFRQPDVAAFELDRLSPMFGTSGRIELERLGESPLDVVELYPEETIGDMGLYLSPVMVGSADRSRAVFEAGPVRRELRSQPADIGGVVDMTPPSGFAVLPSAFSVMRVGWTDHPEGLTWTPLTGTADGIVVGFGNLSVQTHVVTPFERDGLSFGVAERAWILSPTLLSFTTWDADDGGYGPDFLLDRDFLDDGPASLVGGAATWMSTVTYPIISP